MKPPFHERLAQCVRVVNDLLPKKLRTQTNTNQYATELRARFLALHPNAQINLLRAACTLAYHAEKTLEGTPHAPEKRQQPANHQP